MSDRVGKRFYMRALRATCVRIAFLSTLLASAALPAHAVEASTAGTASRDSLFRQTLKRPSDIPLALAYVKACVALKDYEGAIGALERVLFYAPHNAEVEAQLGFLYYQLRSRQMARQYFDLAVAEPSLDAATRAKIADVGSTVDTDNTGRHLFGTVGGGLRFQNNAAFNPDNYVLRLAGQDYAFAHPQDRGADGNAYGLAQIGYDYDLGNQRGDVLETRLTGYLTRQFRFTDLDVGLYDVSIGPRFALNLAGLPDSSIKVYAAGGQTFLDGKRYFASGGGGVVADLGLRPGFVVEPGVEVRRVEFSNVPVFSSQNSGETVTASLLGSATLGEHFDATARVFIQRDLANAGYQSSINIAEEFAVVARFSPPLPMFRGPWSASPYVKLLQTRFDNPNPFIDAAITRRDAEVQVGVVLDMPVTAAIDVVTNIQDARVASNIPNYRLHNFSVLSGPTVRF